MRKQKLSAKELWLRTWRLARLDARHSFPWLKTARGAFSFVDFARDALYKRGLVDQKITNRYWARRLERDGFGGSHYYHVVNWCEATLEERLEVVNRKREQR